MRRLVFCAALGALSFGTASAQEVEPGQAPEAVRLIPFLAPAATILPRDTPVELMAYSEVSTASAKPGQRFKLLVNKPIAIGHRVIVPVGTPAYGEVITAVDSGGLGKSGRMTARLLHIQLGALQIPLEGETSAKGTGAGSAGVAVLFTGITGLFHRGNNAKIKAGEILTGFVAQDVAVDLSATAVRRVPITPGAQP